MSKAVIAVAAGVEFDAGDDTPIAKAIREDGLSSHSRSRPDLKAHTGPEMERSLNAKRDRNLQEDTSRMRVM